MSSRPDHDIERALARALRTEGERIVPAERLEEILAAAKSPLVAEVRPLHSRRVVLAAAAAAAVVAGGLWVVGDRTGPAGRVAGSPSASASAPSATTTSEPTRPPQTRVTSVPVYLVGSEAGAGSRAVLVRVFDRVQLTTTAGPTDLAQQVGAGLRLSTAGSAKSGAIGAVENADASLVTDVTDGDAVVVDLASTPQVRTAQGAEQLLAAWVRTVQGIVARGDVGVRFRAADGRPLFGQLQGGRTWRQGDLSATPLASIWVDDPSGAVAGPDTTARGIASVFEAALRWELLRGGSVVDSGSTMASVGAPARGTWQVRLTGLVPGSYELRVFALSAKDGSLAAERRATFEVTGS